MAADNRETDILIIEDDADIATFLCELLRDEGYRATTLPDDIDLDCVIAAPPRLILLDLMLPRIDGVEVLRRLRAEPGTRAVPVVLMTAAPPLSVYHRLNGCDCAGVLSKPFAIADVIALAAQYARGGALPPPGGGYALDASAN